METAAPQLVAIDVASDHGGAQAVRRVSPTVGNGRSLRCLVPAARLTGHRRWGPIAPFTVSSSHRPAQPRPRRACTELVTISPTDGYRHGTVGRIVQQMRERTAALHSGAERTGIVSALMNGQVSRARYALYLRNLLPAYQSMEQALRWRPELAELAQPPVYRAESIVADLGRLVGANWVESLPLLPAGERYASRIEGAGAGALLIAHCYTRYLGDLNGGQIMGRHLVRLFGPGCPALSFTAFPGIQDLCGFVRSYRAALDRAGEHLADRAPVVEEAAVAFQMNIALSQEVEGFDWPPRLGGHPRRAARGKGGERPADTKPGSLDNDLTPCPM